MDEMNSYQFMMVGYSCRYSSPFHPFKFIYYFIPSIPFSKQIIQFHSFTAMNAELIDAELRIEEKSSKQLYLNLIEEWVALTPLRMNQLN